MPLHIALFTGKLKDGFAPEVVQARVAQRLRMNAEQAAQLFNGRAAIMKKTEDAALCEKTLQQLDALGLCCVSLTLPPLPAGNAVGYKLVYFGEIRPGFAADDVKAAAAQALRLDAAVLGRVFSGKRVALRRMASAEQVARKYAELHAIGMVCTVELEPDLAPLQAEAPPAPVAATVTPPPPASAPPPAEEPRPVEAPPPAAPAGDNFDALLDASSLAQALQPQAAAVVPEAPAPAFDPHATLIVGGHALDQYQFESPPPAPPPVVAPPPAMPARTPPASGGAASGPSAAQGAPVAPVPAPVSAPLPQAPLPQAAPASTPVQPPAPARAPTAPAASAAPTPAPAAQKRSWLGRLFGKK